MMIILQIYNNDWLEIVVYTERTGTIEIEFVAKKILIFFKFFLYSNFFFFILFFYRVLGLNSFLFESDGKIEINNKKKLGWKFFFLKNLKLFFILVRCVFFSCNNIQIWLI